MKPDSMRDSGRSRYKKKRGLRIGSSLQEKCLVSNIQHDSYIMDKSKQTIPSKAWTLSRSVLRIVSSVITPRAFFK
jgi:hypothetical protein